MYVYPELPDATRLVIEYLESYPGLAEFSPYTVAGDITGFIAGNRWISVQATGGNIINNVRVFGPRVDINVYAETKFIANRIARRCVSALNTMKNYSNSEAVVTKVDDVSLPADLTDPVNSNPRYVFDATIYLRPI